ncbi:probable N-acetyltransferase HLS1 [Impatiens glandulifera]|uniref:probable N-acetyltransferase HLS1 n=1 Tax=Impatiens glandulifera TaxID=253017 RepID=UPI001FB06C21|nr:probable N-acetyltransferase HLS1 [Impatiens glandulifera]
MKNIMTCMHIVLLSLSRRFVLMLEKINVRSYNGQRDKTGVEELEKRCQVGSEGKMCFFMDTLGDPICRIRNTPFHNMLVAEVDNEIVGIIQGTIKLVTLCDCLATVGYVLGLRVVPLSRRGGIATTLVRHMEQWFTDNQVHYAYMATDKHNKPSLNLFIDRLGYTIFKSPLILVQPVNPAAPVASAGRRSGVEISMLKPEKAEFLYRKYMGTTDFFPHDIDRVLNHKLSLGTWVSYRRRRGHVPFSGEFRDESDMPESWAMLSVWNGGDVYKLRAEGVTFPCFVYSRSSRLMNWAFPCLNVQEMPDFSDNFGFYFVYGLYVRGRGSGKLVRALFRFVSNVAREKGDCKAIVTEVERMEGFRFHVPHWKLLSGSEDLWCIKSLKMAGEDEDDDEEEEGTRIRSLQQLTTSVRSKRGLFVDPREV